MITLAQSMITRLENLTDGLFRLDWPVDMVIGKILVMLIDLRKTSLKVGGTNVWVWVLN